MPEAKLQKLSKSIQNYLTCFAALNDICTFITLKSFSMPGFELFGEEERKEVNDVLNTGILMRYGFDGPRKGVWKAKELEAVRKCCKP